MPRKPRFNLIGIPQHVVQRGNNREPCFYAEQDYRRYLDDLKDSAEKYGCKIHACRELFRNHLDYDTLHDIRNSLNHEQILGRSYFKDMIDDITQRQTRLGVAGRPSINEPNSIYYVGY